MQPMGKASRRKQLRRAGFLEEKPKREHGLECAYPLHVTRTIDIPAGELPEDIQREISIWDEEEEEKRAVVRAYKKIDWEDNPLSYGVVLDDGEGMEWSAW